MLSRSIVCCLKIIITQGHCLSHASGTLSGSINGPLTVIETHMSQLLDGLEKNFVQTLMVAFPEDGILQSSVN